MISRLDKPKEPTRTPPVTTSEQRNSRTVIRQVMWVIECTPVTNKALMSANYS